MVIDGLKITQIYQATYGLFAHITSFTVFHTNSLRDYMI